MNIQYGVARRNYIIEKEKRRYSWFVGGGRAEISVVCDNRKGTCGEVRGHEPTTPALAENEPHDSRQELSFSLPHWRENTIKNTETENPGQTYQNFLKILPKFSDFTKFSKFLQNLQNFCKIFPQNLQNFSRIFSKIHKM